MERCTVFKPALLVLLAAGLAIAQSPKTKVGKPATPADIAQRDHFVSPDGEGLPPGKGSAAEGKKIYERRCAECHGSQGQGKDEAPLVGGQGTLATPKPLKTVGSYWPYATILFDYINRAMPFDNPGLLTYDQVYAVSALILHWNGIIGEHDVMDASTLPKVSMPNRDGFVADDRPDTGQIKKKAKPRAK
ncbi:MAG: c-type cytochrome [Acidimicrobiia bacterium]|nr:c-type cytochrome [Acidimicrobiia bacterium]